MVSLNCCRYPKQLAAIVSSVELFVIAVFQYTKTFAFFLP